MAGARTATTEARLRDVERLLLAGAARSVVVAHAADHWGIAPRSADRLLALARERLRADWAMDRRQLLAELLAQLATLQQEARERGDLAVALGCINATARLAQVV
jgi:hypothetical protein